MTTATAVWLLILAGFVAANLPWLSERVCFVLKPRSGQKGHAMRLLEWLALYGVMALVAIGIERKMTGGVYPQGWEFYVVTLCLFAVFALPGFVYRYDLKRHLARR